MPTYSMENLHRMKYQQDIAKESIVEDTEIKLQQAQNVLNEVGNFLFEPMYRQAQRDLKAKDEEIKRLKTQIEKLQRQLSNKCIV